MSHKPMPRSDLDLLDWFARGMIAVAVALFVGMFLLCVFIGVQISAPASASASAITSSIEPETTLTCGQRSQQALAGFVTSMSVVVAPVAAVGVLLAAGAFAAMVNLARD